MSDTHDIRVLDPVPDATGFAMHRIERPHPDIELGVERLPIEYLVRLPDTGLDPDTGLILFLGPYGMAPCGVYVRKLLYHLANKYNCLAASVAYFGSDESGAKKCRWIPHPQFFAKLEERYGIEITASKVDTEEIVYRLAVLLALKGQKKLHPDCRLMGIAPEYNSMGFLPALDGLQATHRLIDDYGLNKRRLFLFGSSYGGYIASMMVKFAPRTFRMAIDNSGFSSAEDDIWNVYGSSTLRPIADFAVATLRVCAFSADPAVRISSHRRAAGSAASSSAITSMQAPCDFTAITPASMT